MLALATPLLPYRVVFAAAFAVAFHENIRKEPLLCCFETNPVYTLLEARVGNPAISYMVAL